MFHDQIDHPVQVIYLPHLDVTFGKRRTRRQFSTSVMSASSSCFTSAHEAMSFIRNQWQTLQFHSLPPRCKIQCKITFGFGVGAIRNGMGEGDRTKQRTNERTGSGGERLTEQREATEPYSAQFPHSFAREVCRGNRGFGDRQRD